MNLVLSIFLQLPFLILAFTSMSESHVDTLTMVLATIGFIISRRLHDEAIIDRATAEALKVKNEQL